MISAILKSTLVAATALLVPMTSAYSSNVSEWVIVQGGAVRLVRASEANADGMYRAGVEFRLEEGWHTYWRYPGEAGIPTEANFGSSVNLRSAELLFPAPETYSDGFSTSLVYKERVLLPLLVERTDETRPTIVNATLNFGICKDICVPGEADLSLMLPVNSLKDDDADKLINDAFASLPIGIGDMPSQFSKLEVTGTGKDRLVTFVAEVPRGEKQPELFVEGPAGSYHGVPKLVSVKKGKATWTIPFIGFPKDQAKMDLRLTLVTKNGAFEETQVLNVPQTDEAI